MNSINDILEPVYKRLDAMTTRERVIIAMTLIVATLFLWSELVLNGQLEQRRQAAGQVSELRGEIAAKEAEQVQLKEQLARDPNRELQVRLQRYREEIERVDGLLEEQTLEFISPRQMVFVLKSMVQEEAGLRLVRMESFEPVDPVIVLNEGGDQAANGESNSGERKHSSGAYLHAMELELEGDYLTVLKYIKHLESLEWKFVWRSLSVEMIDYPTTTARLRLETLSQSDGWIGV